MRNRQSWRRSRNKCGVNSKPIPTASNGTRAEDLADANISMAVVVMQSVSGATHEDRCWRLHRCAAGDPNPSRCAIGMALLTVQSGAADSSRLPASSMPLPNPSDGSDQFDVVASTDLAD